MTRSTYSGPFRPKNPGKYKGNHNRIVYRSSWELKMFKYCDLTPSVLAWSSEEIVIPYQDPISGNFRRYFVDVWVKHRLKDGTIKETLIEIKPSKQCQLPKKQKRKTKKYLKEVETYVINKAKWKAADKYASKRGMEFTIFTEKELGIK